MSLLERTVSEIAPPDVAMGELVQVRLDGLTKPPGSLGRLEELAVRLGQIQQRADPRVDNRLVVVMAADHGISKHGVSAYPAEVTAQMVANFLRGGAAINSIARTAGARVLVVDMGVAFEVPDIADPSPDCTLLEYSFGAGTNDILDGQAMTREQAIGALEVGISIAQQAASEGVQLLAGGDMGICNTTTSAILTALITGQSVDGVIGRGTGADDDVMQTKRSVVGRAIAIHRDWRDGVDLLSRAGGFEIAGLAGLMLGAASRNIPFVLDGFIATAAALVAHQIAPEVRHSLIAAHLSAEPGHSPALRQLQLQPLLTWNMRLGEGTGAVLCFPLLDAAARLLAEMATFQSAGISTPERRS